ncbi:MAG: hypothetical protein HYT29_01945 [Parcubacteria group bacterium]|nr:hypothetical protein [Parcubacteria group bacterium]
MFLFKKRLHSVQRTERAKKRFVYFLLGGVFLFLGGAMMLSWASYREEISLRIVRVSGAGAVAEGDIREIVDAELAGSYFKIFNRANSFLYPRRNIERKLVETFPRLASVSVYRVNFQELGVKVEERVPSYLWCGPALPEKDARAQCYFLDPLGVAFARAPYFSGAVYFELYGKMNGENILESREYEPPIGFSFLPPDDFKRIIAFRDALRASDMPPEKLILEETGDAAFFFPSGLRLSFHLTQNFHTVLFNLLAALDTEPLQKEFFYSAEKNPYEFLDARFENRIFYK